MWAYDEKAKLKAMFEMGFSDKKIADKLNKSHKSVESKRRRMGLTHWKQNKWDEEELNKLRKLFNAGYKDKEISHMLNREKNSVVSKRIALNLFRDERKNGS